MHKFTNTYIPSYRHTHSRTHLTYLHPHTAYSLQSFTNGALLIHTYRSQAPRAVRSASALAAANALPQSPQQQQPQPQQQLKHQQQQQLQHHQMAGAMLSGMPPQQAPPYHLLEGNLHPPHSAIMRSPGMGSLNARAGA